MWNTCPTPGCTVTYTTTSAALWMVTFRRLVVILWGRWCCGSNYDPRITVHELRSTNYTNLHEFCIREILSQLVKFAPQIVFNRNRCDDFHRFLFYRVNETQAACMQ